MIPRSEIDVIREQFEILHLCVEQFMFLVTNECLPTARNDLEQAAIHDSTICRGCDSEELILFAAAQRRSSMISGRVISSTTASAANPSKDGSISPDSSLLT